MRRLPNGLYIELQRLVTEDAARADDKGFSQAILDSTVELPSDLTAALHYITGLR